MFPIEFVKYLGFFVVGASAIISFFGDNRQNGKLTTIGKVLLFFTVIGIIIAIIGDRLSVKDLRTKERISIEWNRILDEPIVSIDIDRFIVGDLQLDELKKFIDNQEIAFGISETSNTTGAFHKIGLSYVTNEPNNITAKYTIEDCHSGNVIEEEVCSLYKSRINKGWLEAYFSTDISWKTADYSCGVSGNIPWDRFPFPDVSNVKDLTKLAFRFKTPESFKFNSDKIKLVEKKKPYIILSIHINTPSFTFLLNPESFGYITLIDETKEKVVHHLEASISGHKLLTYCYNQFEKAGGIRSDKIKQKQDEPLHVFEVIPLNFELSRRLIKL